MLLKSQSVGDIPWKEKSFTPTTGQITFIIPNIPIDLIALNFYVNGVQCEPVTQFIVSGSTITWLNTPFSLGTSDWVQIKYK